jgi:hypothetical protein
MLFSVLLNAISLRLHVDVKLCLFCPLLSMPSSAHILPFVSSAHPASYLHKARRTYTRAEGKARHLSGGKMSQIVSPPPLPLSSLDPSPFLVLLCSHRRTPVHASGLLAREWVHRRPEVFYLIIDLDTDLSLISATSRETVQAVQGHDSARLKF